MIDQFKLQSSMDFAVKKVDQLMEDFSEDFPRSQSKNYVYPKTGCKDWTDGFWVGMVLLAYEHTKDTKYLKAVEKLNQILRNRVEKRIALNHHDLGFLYSLSCVAKYKIDGDEYAKETAIMAADVLLERYKEKGEFIQAWGDLDDDNKNFLIIDCLLNLPLLYWASDVTGNSKYRDIAEKHQKTALSVVIRDDFTTFHTYLFDPKTGEPVKGKTAQGYSDDSCWARGQAWGVYGIALCYAYTKDESLIDLFYGVTDVFLNKLPSDHVPYWDLIFSDGSGEPRDTSSAVITACGILEMNQHHPLDKSYLDYVDKMLSALIDNYTTRNMPESNAILTDAMLSRPQGHQPEAAIYGDYYFMEALIRFMNKDWIRYW